MSRTVFLAACLLLVACQPYRAPPMMARPPQPAPEALVQAIGRACHAQFQPPPNATPEQRLQALDQKYDCIDEREAAEPSIAGSSDYALRRRYLAIERQTNEQFIAGRLTEAEALGRLEAARAELAAETARQQAVTPPPVAASAPVQPARVQRTLHPCRLRLSPTVTMAFVCL